MTDSFPLGRSLNYFWFWKFYHHNFPLGGDNMLYPWMSTGLTSSAQYYLLNMKRSKQLCLWQRSSDFVFLTSRPCTCDESELLSLRSEWGDEPWAPQDGGLGWPASCLITPDWLCCTGLPEPCCCWGCCCCWAWPKSLWMGCCNNICITHKQKILYSSFILFYFKTGNPLSKWCL